jgi:DNA-binding transcriptional ArsR family regulator
MVVQELSEADVDLLFHALADATRRDIVVRVMAGEHSVTALADRYAMSFAAVQKHVAVLQRARIVVKERKGREQMVSGNPEAVRRARRLLDDYERIWRHRADQIRMILAEDPREGEAP